MAYNAGQNYYNKDWEGLDDAGLSARRNDAIAAAQRYKKVGDTKAYQEYTNRLNGIDAYARYRRANPQTPSIPSVPSAPPAPGGATGPATPSSPTPAPGGSSIPTSGSTAPVPGGTTTPTGSTTPSVPNGSTTNTPTYNAGNEEYNNEWGTLDDNGLVGRRNAVKAAIQQYAKTDPARAAVYQKRLHGLDAYIGWKRKNGQSSVVTDPADNGTTPGGTTGGDTSGGTTTGGDTSGGTTGGDTPGGTTGGGTTDPYNPFTKENMATMFQEIKSFEDNPSYVKAKQAGMDDLQAMAAARGLTGSGFESDQAQDFLGNMYAKESERVNGIQEQQADRFLKVLEDVSTQKERMSNEQWDRLQSIMNLMAQQSPMTSAYQATGSGADILASLGKLDANQLSQMYTKFFGGGGGGGGGGSSIQYPKPVDSGPNYSQLALAQIFGNTSSNSGYIDALNKLISGLTS